MDTGGRLSDHPAFTLTERDGRSWGLDSFPSGRADFAPALLRAEENGAQMILSLFDMPESSDLVKQWHQRKSRALLCGFISPMAGAGAFKTFGEKIAGSLNVAFELGNLPSARWEPARVFYQAYKERYGMDIESGHGPAPAYESVYILAEALEKAGTPDADAVVTALEATDRMGAMGRMRFHKGHQIIFGRDPENEALACIFQWQRDGRRKIVYPAFPSRMAKYRGRIPCRKGKSSCASGVSYRNTTQLF